MSGSDNKQTTTTSAEPYKASQPLLDKGMEDALAQYNNGGLVQPNTMSTVVPMSGQTTQGLQGTQANVQALMSYDPSSYATSLWDTIAQRGYNDEQLNAVRGISETANSTFDINSNPAYAGIRQRAMDAAADAANSTAAGLGRYGSGTHQTTLTRDVGNVAADMDYNEYNNWLTRRSDAQQQLFNAGQAGQENLTTAATDLQQPWQDLLGVGTAYEDLMGRQMNDQLRISSELQNLPLANIQALLAAASGSGSYGTQTQTAQGANSSLSNILGAGLGGLSLLGSL